MPALRMEHGIGYIKHEFVIVLWHPASGRRRICANIRHLCKKKAGTTEPGRDLKLTPSCNNDY
ncbi:MAG TPA: hypothetical protein VH621_01295 [Nitrososphaera sp.]